jgi:hypothetical protein
MELQQPPPVAQQPQLSPALLGSASPFLVSLAYSKFEATNTYARGPTSLVYSHRKRWVITLAGLLVLLGAIVLSTVCLYNEFCIASTVGTRTTYSQGASTAVIPVCLILMFILAPLSCLAAHLQRPGLTAIATGCQVSLACLILFETRSCLPESC